MNDGDDEDDDDDHNNNNDINYESNSQIYLVYNYDKR